MPMKSKPLFGLVGTITQDTIAQASGRVLSGLGGILYQAAGLSGLDQNITLYTNVSQDLFPRIQSLLGRWPGCDSAGIEIVSGPGNRVVLHYPEDGERVEVLESHVPPLRPDKLLNDLPRLGFLILVLNSGWDISVSDWRRVVGRARCPVWLDIHSLVLTMELHTVRRYRPLPEWREWAAGVTYLQANLKEVASMLGNPERIPQPDELADFGKETFRLGVKGLFITLGSEGVLVLMPGTSRKVPPPTAGRVLDTTGCGDVFCAGTAALLAAGRPLPEAAAFGVELASEAARVSGVEPTFNLIRQRVYSA